jgi:hypothetical protein
MLINNYNQIIINSFKKTLVLIVDLIWLVYQIKLHLSKNLDLKF